MHRFEYDAGGSRTVKRDPTTTTIYAGEHYRCTGATNPSSNTVSCAEHQYGVFVGDRLIAEITKDSTGNTEKQRYVHSDHLGSSTLITDETGATTEKRSFKPFGQAKAAFTDTDLRAGFTGHEHDSELGLINMRGRMYDPKLRRFVTPDPFVTEPWNPAGLNRFAYVQNSPLNFVDPSGFEGEQHRGEEAVTTQVVIDSQGRVCGIMGFNIYYTSSAPPEGAGSYPIGYPEMLGANQTHDSHLVRGDGSGQASPHGPTSGSMAPPDMGGGTSQSGGTTLSSSGPTTSMGSHTQRSGDGSGGATGSGQYGQTGAPVSGSPLGAAQIGAGERLIYQAIAGAPLAMCLIPAAGALAGVAEDALFEALMSGGPGLAMRLAPVLGVGLPAAGGGAGTNLAKTASTALGRSIQSLKAQLGGVAGPWNRLSAHAEGASSAAKRLQGATSIEELFVHGETGERLIRHTVVRDGEILHETFRNFAKFGAD